jgi:hypothetical protein
MGMKQWNTRRLISMGLILGGLALMILAKAVPVRAGLVLPVAAGILFLLQEEKRVWQQRSDVRMLRMLAVYRHDWMNDIQVLFGYIRLQKYEKLLDYMDKINAKVHQESCVAKLGVSSLTAFYYAFRTQDQPLDLEFEFDEEIQLSQLPIRAEHVSTLIRRAVERFAECAVPDRVGEVNRLSLAFDVEDDGLLLDFVFEGEISPGIREELSGLMDAFAADKPVLEQEWTEGRTVAAIRIPFLR